MSTSAAAIAISAAALAEAQSARVQSCKASMRGFQNDGATVAEIRQYADCVHNVYPSELSGGSVTVIKAAIVVLLICAVIGAVRGWRETGFGRFESAAFGALGWVLGAAVVMLVGLLVAGGIAFLVS